MTERSSRMSSSQVAPRRSPLAPAPHVLLRLRRCAILRQRIRTPTPHVCGPRHCPLCPWPPRLLARGADSAPPATERRHTSQGPRAVCQDGLVEVCEPHGLAAAHCRVHLNHLVLAGGVLRPAAREPPAVAAVAGRSLGNPSRVPLLRRQPTAHPVRCFIVAPRDVPVVGAKRLLRVAVSLPHLS